jgi:hypothetical protein
MSTVTPLAAAAPIDAPIAAPVRETRWDVLPTTTTTTTTTTNTAMGGMSGGLKPTDTTDDTKPTDTTDDTDGTDDTDTTVNTWDPPIESAFTRFAASVVDMSDLDLDACLGGYTPRHPATAGTARGPGSICKQTGKHLSMLVLAADAAAGTGTPPRAPARVRKSALSDRQRLAKADVTTAGRARAGFYRTKDQQFANALKAYAARLDALQAKLAVDQAKALDAHKEAQRKIIAREAEVNFNVALAQDAYDFEFNVPQFTVDDE